MTELKTDARLLKTAVMPRLYVMMTSGGRTSLILARHLKNKLGENSKQTIKKDCLGRFKVRFLIDKTTVKYKR